MTTPSLNPPPPVANPQGLQVLWVNCRLLHPLNGGDRIRTYNMLRQLKRTHHITYLCFRTTEDTDESAARAREFCHELIMVPYRSVRNGSLRFAARVILNSLRGGIPFFAEKYRSPEMTRRIREFLNFGAIDLVVVDYLASMVQLIGLNEERRTPIVIFQHNVESQIWKRHSETDANPIKRAIFRKQWRMTCKWERACAALVDGQVTVSEEDCKSFREQLGMRNVLGAVPTGVDVNYFAPSLEPKRPRSLVFLGTMDWMANIDAVIWFVNESLPGVRRRFPDTVLTIVGRNPPAHVQALAKADSGIRVTGTVADVRPFLVEAEVMIVPLRVGGGTRIKIYEGMATGIPVVSTSVGAEGLRVKHGENILLADSPADFARCVCNLFENPELRKRVGENGLEMVGSSCSWESVTRIFEQYCLKVCDQSKKRS